MTRFSPRATVAYLIAEELTQGHDMLSYELGDLTGGTGAVLRDWGSKRPRKAGYSVPSGVFQPPCASISWDLGGKRLE